MSQPSEMHHPTAAPGTWDAACSCGNLIRHSARRTAEAALASHIGELPERAQRERQHARSEATVEALAMFLLYRDWPSAKPRDLSLRYEYRCRAAAILNGEAWAIKTTRPEAMPESYGTRGE